MPPKYIHLITTKEEVAELLGCENPNCPHIPEWGKGTSMISLALTRHEGVYCFERNQHKYNKPIKK